MVTENEKLTMSLAKPAFLAAKKCCARKQKKKRSVTEYGARKRKSLKCCCGTSKLGPRPLVTENGGLVTENDFPPEIAAARALRAHTRLGHSRSLQPISPPLFISPQSFDHRRVFRSSTCD